MEYLIEIEGERPLLMHNARYLADPVSAISKQIKAISGKRLKTDQDYEDMSRLEFKGGLYLNNDGPFIPGEALERCLRDAGTITRQGKQVQRAVTVLDAELPLIYDGPKDEQGLWNAGNGNGSPFVDKRQVKVQGNRVTRTRPIFNTWELQAVVQVDPSILNEDEFREIIERAGDVGLGTFRPRFGRFNLVRIRKVG